VGVAPTELAGNVRYVISKVVRCLQCHDRDHVRINKELVTHSSTVGGNAHHKLDESANSRRPLDRLKYVFALCDHVTLTFDLLA